MTPKTPGTYMGDPKTPLSPTFREEQILEKHEQKVEKLDQKDLVSRIALVPVSYRFRLLTPVLAMENPCPHGKGYSSMSQLCLLSGRSRPHLVDSRHLPRHKESPNPQQLACLGSKH